MISRQQEQRIKSATYLLGQAFMWGGRVKGLGRSPAKPREWAEPSCQYTSRKCKPLITYRDATVWEEWNADSPCSTDQSTGWGQVNQRSCVVISLLRQAKWFPGLRDLSKGEERQERTNTAGPQMTWFRSTCSCSCHYIIGLMRKFKKLASCWSLMTYSILPFIMRTFCPNFFKKK